MFEDSALIFFFFFFNDTATTEIYTFSLHDALPIFKGVIGAAVDGYVGIYRIGFSLINQATGGKLGEMVNTVRSKVVGVKDAFVNGFNNIRDHIRGVIDAIKGFFHFNVSLPNINLPHFHINPSGWQIGDLLKGSIPSLGIDWYAKAMDNGMILDRPTIFGAAGGQLLGRSEER